MVDDLSFGVCDNQLGHRMLLPWEIRVYPPRRQRGNVPWEKKPFWSSRIRRFGSFIEGVAREVRELRLWVQGQGAIFCAAGIFQHAHGRRKEGYDQLSEFSSDTPPFR